MLAIMAFKSLIMDVFQHKHHFHNQAFKHLSPAVAGFRYAQHSHI